MGEWISLVPLGGLLVLSAFFSSAETALFNLEEPSRAGTRAERLLQQPRDLLVTILLGNLVVNVLFFALAPRLLEGLASEWVARLGALVAILLAGEILPKALALSGGPKVARFAAAPMVPLVAALGPVRTAINGLLDVTLRALGQDQRAEVRIDAQHLDEALQRSAQKGHIAPGEADLLAEIVELSHLRVREIMTPRVDALMLDLEDSPEEREQVVRDAVRQRQTWLPVVRGDADQVEGVVRVRELLLDPERPLEARIMPVCFVPEVGGVLQMLQTLRDSRVAQAIVVDEWGGTAGVVTLEQLFEELFGDLRVEGEEADHPVIPIGEGRFRVSGDLSIRDWNDLLGVQVVPNAFETVGGLVLAALDRLPRVGDRVELGGGLVGEVREVRGRRVQSVDLFLEQGARP